MTEQEKITATETAGQDQVGGRQSLWPKIFLAGFFVYLALLIIGVVAEVFKIQSILDWWIWKPPGKP